MYNPSDFRKGLRIVVDDQPYTVVDYQHAKMGRGRANIRTKLKHIKTGAVIEKVFSSGDSFKPPDVANRKMQYLYENTGEFMFMDIETYEQVTIPAENLGDAKWYLIENGEYQVLFLDGQAISVDLPASVILEVTATEPAARGDTVSNVTKPAKLETGHVVQVPSFINECDVIRVNTETDAYLSRA